MTTFLPNFDGKPTFDAIQIPDDQTLSDKSSASKKEKNVRKQSFKRLAKSWARKTIKLTLKSMINGRNKALITQLAILLDNDWEENNKVIAFQASCYNDITGSKVDTETDSLHILAIAIYKTNGGDTSKFTSLTQLDIEKPETYKRAMYGLRGQQWAQAIKKELDQLKKNKTWTLVSKHSIESSHKPLSEKWVFKVKKDVNGAISRFKAQWVVRGYLQQFGINFDQTFAAVVKRWFSEFYLLLRHIMTLISIN